MRLVPDSAPLGLAFISHKASYGQRSRPGDAVQRKCGRCFMQDYARDRCSKNFNLLLCLTKGAGSGAIPGHHMKSYDVDLMSSLDAMVCP